MEKLNLDICVNDKKSFEQLCNSVETFDETIFNKLKEAEVEMNSTTERYSKEDIIKSINDIL